VGAVVAVVDGVDVVALVVDEGRHPPEAPAWHTPQATRTEAVTDDGAGDTHRATVPSLSGRLGRAPRGGVPPVDGGRPAESGIMGTVPELPEVQALVEFLDEHARGRTIERCELGAVAALKTFDPSLTDLVGRPVTSCTRRGKFVCLDLDGLWLVVHLARGGWVKWWDVLPATKARPSRSPIALRVGFATADFAPSPGFDVTEMGTEKRLALWVVHRPEDVEPLAALGPDPLDPAFDLETLGAILSTAPGSIKNALSTQSLIAGVGNAYSDEVLHAAKLSPFKPAAKLNPEELERVHAALLTILGQATERSSGRSAKELKGEKKRAMRVHGRTGEPCPVCGDVVREVSYATKSLQYCATCQTGGKPLADRRLSRLLK
jgi:formamidopyrimidine-DNA glycosylase